MGLDKCFVSLNSLIFCAMQGLLNKVEFNYFLHPMEISFVSIKFNAIEKDKSIYSPKLEST